MLMNSNNNNISEYFPETVFHPGVDLKEKVEEMGMSTKEFAEKTGKSEKAITGILNGDEEITHDLAEQFERVLKIPAEFWLRRQHQFNKSI